MAISEDVPVSNPAFQEQLNSMKAHVLEYAKLIDGKDCDKCGSPVRSWESAALFTCIQHLGHVVIQMEVSHRHLPAQVGDKNVITCAGSPSRWAAITGTRDPRPEYSQVVLDPIAVHIWEFMQALRPFIERGDSPDQGVMIQLT